ncbi:sensor histidine kinase [Streptomyces ochraceiscleroticus]|uniref:histidine kinase n=1 Tax=Streptomyces ochraceiscleroticus TaxID=47761 RepID=A0ABW1MED0_9ACTN|nr:nitrate- and nitrite sensing domain-containing protein [Streptomyces ochraceiscleroticus]
MRRSKSGPAPQQAAQRGNFTPPPRHTASPSDAPESPLSSQPARGSRMSPRNWRVATRLNAILLLPVILALIFAGLRVNTSVSTWNEAQDAENTAKLVQAAASYGQALVDERDRTAAPLLQGKQNDPVVRNARAETDAAAADFHDAVRNMPDKPGLKRRLAVFEKVEPKLQVLRKAAYTSQLTGVQTEEGYTEVQHPLMEFSNELGLGTGNITSYGRTVYAVSLAKAATSLQRSIGTHLLVHPATGAKERKKQLTAFASYAYLENIAIGEYTSGGTPEDVERLKTDSAALKKKGQEQAAKARKQAIAAGRAFQAPPSIDAMVQAISSGASPQLLAAKGVTPQTWFAASTGKFDMYRGIEEDLADKAVAEAAQIADDAQQTTFVDSGVALGALIIAFLIAGLMARSMTRNMQELRTAAFGIAEQRLPMLVDQLSRTDPGRVDTRVKPIPISTTDEIGEVARAFDQVHREAVRLAAEQALLRGNVNAIFTNLSRRNQGLIERQLTLITELENNEADPDQLENLFSLDHLATRMRRNGENLLILAGEEPGRRWTQPVPLVDVLRAATSEVESYERIELQGFPESEIHGQAVTDLVHLLSELLENATTFSSPQTKVRVTATRLPDGRVMIEIHDKGIGLTPEDFADINHKLANPPTVDIAISQRMGLFVVGRLADRHGIRVQLRPSGEQAGTTSLVMLPEAITHGGGGEDQFEDDFTVSRIMPEHPQSFQQPEDMRTAAELGFDDHYRPSDDSADLDPVGRSLLREERRAALEAQNGAPRHGAPGQEPAQHPAQDFGGLPRRAEAEGSGAAYDGFQEQPYAPQEATGRQSYDGPAGAYDDRSFGGQNLFDQGSSGLNGEQPQYSADGRQGPGRSEPAPFQGYFGGQAESDHNGPDAPAQPQERVAFDRPGPTPSETHSLTDAGLPRRGGDKAPGQQEWQQPEEPASPPQQRSTSEDSFGWRTANDERWQRAEQLREPKAGGITSSGLPRRVPKANLVEGTAEQTQQGGPQVSRAPEDVRGRLSNLRRGVQQGRSAGMESPKNDQQGFGPGSTYDQER